MIMSEMIERVATELYKNSGMTYSATSYWRMMARAAIAAMREPTQEMVEAGIHCGDGYGKQPETFIAMIDAALKE